jgi:protein Tex
MELSGTVLNVVDFGAFVDIGMHDSGLVHVSQMAGRYVRDPHEVVSVGDVVRVWVAGVDKERRRVALTMIPPGQRREEPPWKRKKQQREQAPAAAGQQAGGQANRGRRKRQFEKKAHSAPPPPQRKPKPLKPLTKAMEEGREPLRTFGDLLQFYQKKKKPE